MKIEREGQAPIIIGKRVPVGAAIGSLATVFASIFPEHATAIIGSTTVITFIAQIIIANWIGVTSE